VERDRHIWQRGDADGIGHRPQPRRSLH
jgi:hypothetical protein